MEESKIKNELMNKKKNSQLDSKIENEFDLIEKPANTPEWNEKIHKNVVGYH